MELKDIQGLLIRGHGSMKKATYFMLAIEDATKAKQWLSALIPRITDGESQPSTERFQLAFTYAGLIALGLKQGENTHFVPEFVQGMVTPYRSRILGDLADSDPENWAWGGSENAEIHILLLAFAVDEAQMQTLSAQLSNSFSTDGLKEVHRIEGHFNPGAKEHFGFRDGISQPVMSGLPNEKGEMAENIVATGEFILGYDNAYNHLPDSPFVDSISDSKGLLPVSASETTQKDFGKNGSYMVFRQLKQEVKHFWQFIHSEVSRQNPAASEKDMAGLAAKMMGRWPNGTPMAVSPNEEKEALAKENNFLYDEQDKEGLRCPMGSHVRRANPRDVLQGSKPEKAVRVSNRHRILRRGRNFGPPVADSFAPMDILNAPDDGKERGLLFICFNANISRQFEFIQHNWSNNTKFEGLYDDPDPILGIKDTRNKKTEHIFTIPAKPLRKQVRGLKRFVHVSGGAYFFMPGINALRYLANL